MAVGIGTVTTGAINNVAATTNVTFVSTTAPLYVIVPVWFATTTLSTVTYGGTGLTRVAQSALSTSGNDRVEIWRLLAPASGSATLAVNFAASAGQSGTVAVFNTTGQDTTTPEGTAATNAATANGTATGSLSISGAASGDLVIVGIAVGNGAAVTPANTGGTGLTEFMDVASNGEGSEAFRIADAVTAVSGSWTGSTTWAIAAIPLKVASAAFDPATVPPLTLSAMPLQGQQIGQY